jgi:hypothetical protein
MSSFVYGIVTAKRAVAPAGKSQTTVAPAMGTYIDTLAALVPAEALALYAGIVAPYATHAVSVHGKKVTVISDPILLSWGCAGLLVLSSLLYTVGRKNANLKSWDALRLLIPPAALAAWMLVQNPGVWDIWWPGSSIGARVVIAAFAAVLLAILASALGYMVNQAPGAPTVKDVNPDSGSVAGGERVILTGSEFTGATQVNFGTVAALDLAVASDTKLTVTSPRISTDGTVDVTVTTSAGTSAPSAADQFTYETAAAAPVVTGVNPDRGSVAAGGETVTVTGTGFTGATQVSFGAVAALDLAVASDTQLTVTSPPPTTGGTVDVTVTNPAGTSARTVADQFTYLILP